MLLMMHPAASLGPQAGALQLLLLSDAEHGDMAVSACDPASSNSGPASCCRMLPSGAAQSCLCATCRQNPYADFAYDGVMINPFEVLFVKVRSWVFLAWRS